MEEMSWEGRDHVSRRHHLDANEHTRKNNEHNPTHDLRQVIRPAPLSLILPELAIRCEGTDEFFFWEIFMEGTTWGRTWGRRKIGSSHVLEGD